MIDPQYIDPSTLPAIPLDSRRQLPPITCVYLAIDSLGVVQYVGQSVNLKNRWASHHRFNRLNLMGDIRIAWVEIDDRALLNETEVAFIEWFNPPLNGEVFFKTFSAEPKAVAVQGPGQTKENVGPHLYCKLAVLMAKKEPGLSKTKLSEDTGLDIMTINRLFRNHARRFDVATVETLCRYFKCGIDDLFELREEQGDH